MLARVRSATLSGIEAATVFVEVDVTAGLPSFTTVGSNLPLSSESESEACCSGADLLLCAENLF